MNQDKIYFNHSPKPTIGVEAELYIVSKENYNLCSGSPNILEFFKDDMGVEIKFETEVKTLPDTPGCTETGGRNDLFFYIADDDIGKFAVPRFSMGVRWWEDVLGNGNGKLYPTEVLERYSKTW